jgi:DNA polymerase
LRFAHASGAWIVPGEAAAADPAQPLMDDSDAETVEALEAVRQDLGECTRCRLCERRTHIVFGVGDPGARVMFVGEAPGEEEDRKGEPFVGRAGSLLDRMIRALGLGREQVYIANVLKCRPPGNRDPAPDEAATCLPFLWRQIDVIRPRVICALGAHATNNLMGTDAAIGGLRGRAQQARGWTVLPLYHPAYLLRTPLAKRLAWRDLQTLKQLLREPG